MSVNTIDYKGNLGSADANRLMSRNIWGDCPIMDLLEGTVPGVYYYDDWQDWPLIGTQTTQIGFGKYKLYNTGAGVFDKVTSVNSVELAGGCMQVSLDTDNDSGTIAQAQPTYYLSNSLTTAGKLWFECCYAQNSIATNMASVFFGLAEVDQFTLAATVPLNAGDPINNSGSILAFRIAEDGLGVVDTAVSDRATSFTNIGATEGGTMAANTFAKYGFVYDPAADASRRIVFYLNNLELTTKYTDTNLAATTNLKANPLGLIWASCADSAGTSFKGFMKWWRVAQLFPN